MIAWAVHSRRLASSPRLARTLASWTLMTPSRNRWVLRGIISCFSIPVLEPLSVDLSSVGR